MHQSHVISFGMEKQLANTLLKTDVIGIICLSYSVLNAEFWCWICYSVPIIHLVHTFYRSLKISQINDRGVVITGCGNGFGLELAKSLHSLGFTVFAGCRNDRCDGALTLKKLGNETGRLHVIQMDVTKKDEVDAALFYVERNLPKLGLWGLVNNAGFTNLGFAEWLPIKNYKKMADVNIWGVVSVTKAFLPLIRKYQGRIVNVGSLLGRLPALYSSAYCITKYGVEAFSDILRLEMARFKVGVSIIEPGNFLAATAIVDAKRLKLFWSQLNESLRKDYGEDSVDEVIGAIDWMSNTFGNKDTSPVIIAMEDALIRRYPKSRYFVASILDKALAYFYQFLPTFVYDFIMLKTHDQCQTHVITS